MSGIDKFFYSIVQVVLKVWDHISCKVKKYLLFDSYRKSLPATREGTYGYGEVCQVGQEAERIMRCSIEEIRDLAASKR